MTVVLSDISAALSQIFDAQLARQVNRTARTLSLLTAKPGSGKNVAWDVSLDGVTAGTHTEGDDPGSSDFTSDEKTNAVLSWGLYRSQFALSEHAIEVAMTSAGSAAALMDLVEESMSEHLGAIASKLNRDLFTGSGSNSLIGLESAIDDGNTYAGINRASESLWRATVLANGGVNRALTVALMDQADGYIYSKYGQSADLIVCGVNVFNKFKALGEAEKRVVNDANYTAGFKDDGVFYKGTPVIRDKDCPANKMFFLNTGVMEVVFVPPQMPQDSINFTVKIASGLNPADQGSPSGIPVRVSALGKTGDSVKFMLRTSCQLRVRKPSALAVIEDITE
jgi:hypothetical protein